MSKDELIKLDGIIEEVLPNTMFRVRISENHLITATLGGRLRKHNIRISLGDSVQVEMSPYDLTRGRVVYRTR